MEVVDAYERGTLTDRIVVYNTHGNRREGMTVKDLVDASRASKKSGDGPYRK